MLLIFSHKLTETQETDAKSQLNIDEFIYLPEELQNLWSNINPFGAFQQEWLKPIMDWIIEKGNKDECCLLIQGEFGATYLLVAWAQKLGYQTVYSTSKRKVIERREGSEVVTQRIFEHVQFREYPRLCNYSNM